MRSGLISEDAIQRKVDTVRDMFRLWSSNPSQAQVSSLASFIHHGYITEVQKMWLKNIDLSEVAHASALADVIVTDTVFISDVTGNIAPILSQIKCKMLWISKMRLSTENTADLVQGMQTSVERVRLGDGGPVELGGGGPVELDMDTLLNYDGRGHCEKVQCGGETGVRYRDQLATWGKNIGWRVKKDSYYVEIFNPITKGFFMFNPNRRGLGVATFPD